MTSRDIIANEKNILGCLLRSPHDFWAINDGISPDMFTLGHHRDIYTAIRDLSEAGRQVTFTALQAHLPEEYEDHGPTIGILAALRENAMEAGSAKDYVDVIAGQAASRQLIALAKWLEKEARNIDRPPDEVAADLGIRAQEILSSASPVRPHTIGEITSRILSATKVSDQDAVPSGLDTGIVELDDILGRMIGGDLGFIIASQGDGKSALAAQIAMHVARSNRPVLYVQMEMSEDQMGARELASTSGLDLSVIQEQAFDFAQRDSVVEAGKSLKSVPLHILDVEEITVRQIRAHAMRMQRRGGLGLIVIDQLDKIRPEGKHKDIFERLGEVTSTLKRMAKGLKVPTICLAQRTRSAQRRDDPTPHVLDTDARTIERDADWIIGLWQRVNWLRMNPPSSKAGGEQQDAWEGKIRSAEGLAEIITLKNRGRKAFQRRQLTFEGEIMRFCSRT